MPNENVVQWGGRNPVWPSSDFRVLIRNRTWQRQPKPFLRPLPYSAELHICHGNGPWSSADSAKLWRVEATGVHVEVQNRSYNNLQRNLHNVGQAGWLINAAQYRQSRDMINNRVVQLLRAVRAAKRMDIAELRNVLNLQPKRVRAKDPAGLWLESTFGWAPLYSDIHHATDLLQSPPPCPKVRGSATRAGTVLIDGKPVDYVVRHNRQCTVRVTNPNLYLANRLGLVNPALVAWDAVPFSFVVDWFIPVGGFLRQWTDFVGLELEDAFNSTKWICVEEYTDGVWNKHPRIIKRNSRKFVRALGLGAAVQLQPRIDFNLGMWHLATSVSLLMQKLGSLPRR